MADDRTQAQETDPVERAEEPYEAPTLEPLGSVHAKTLLTAP